MILHDRSAWVGLDKVIGKRWGLLAANLKGQTNASGLYHLKLGTWELYLIILLCLVLHLGKT